MTEVTYYIAEDGKQFDDESECWKYEMSLKDWSCVEFFNEDLERLDPNDGLEELYEYSMHLHIINAERAKEVFRFLYEMYGFYTPEKYEDGDLLSFNEQEQDWFDPVEKAREAMRIVNTLVGKRVMVG